MSEPKICEYIRDWGTKGTTIMLQRCSNSLEEQGHKELAEFCDRMGDNLKDALTDMAERCELTLTPDWKGKPEHRGRRE